MTSDFLDIDRTFMSDRAKELLFSYMRNSGGGYHFPAYNYNTSGIVGKVIHSYNTVTTHHVDWGVAFGIQNFRFLVTDITPLGGEIIINTLPTTEVEFANFGIPYCSLGGAFDDSFVHYIYPEFIARGDVFEVVYKIDKPFFITGYSCMGNLPPAPPFEPNFPTGIFSNTSSLPNNYSFLVSGFLLNAA